MKNILYFVIGLLLIVFSNTILNDIDLIFFSYRPNLMLIYLVFISIYIGAEKASIIGLALGLIIDISVGKYFAYYGLLFISIGYLYGSLKEKVFKENIFTVILLVVIATIIDNLLISTIVGFRGIELGMFLLRIVEAVFINGIISAFLFYPLNIVLNKVEEQW
ncbi:membrane protein of unknown function [Acetoanaerobium sticklandii]|uniref:Uncharacterized protein n=1 Tax=Acetoanaerobium sticklandii (strain ATCC 12662 / DSM 519 / JCM 1433 / CCUG 9281 / NCIMB 10654 / HF) TaxID=499177 RepID=E3PRK9_ACESD|nr:rod shape-determining protein MreD [Acetoanaerobium sticklandii]CBH21513.1 membrane protein of unknown function [Acetoanaerobium sticklandii]